MLSLTVFASFDTYITSKHRKSTFVQNNERAFFGDYHQMIVKNAKKNVNAIKIPIHMKKPITPPK